MDYNNPPVRRLPRKTNLPFFSYGIFRPGEIAYHSIEGYVVGRSSKAQVLGETLLRDGVLIVYTSPVLAPSSAAEQKIANGWLIHFHPEQAEKAYCAISDREPDKLYEWKAVETCDGKWCNILIGKLRTGAQSLSAAEATAEEWSSWNDPHFGIALKVIDEEPTSSEIFNEEKDLWILYHWQMRYQLIWTIVERFLFLRYGIGRTPEHFAKISESEWFLEIISQSWHHSERIKNRYLPSTISST